MPLALSVMRSAQWVMQLELLLARRGRLPVLRAMQQAAPLARPAMLLEASAAA
jgi:hypothetical protein